MGAHEILAARFLADHPEAGAGILEAREISEVGALLAGIEAKTAAAVLRRMGPVAAAACLEALEPGPAAKICAEVPLGKLAVLLRRLSPQRIEPILSELDADMARAAQSVLRYPEGTAGALMDPQALALPRDLGVREARRMLRAQPSLATYYLYVIDREGMLVGVLNLRELLLAPPERHLTEITHSPVASVNATVGQREVLDHSAWRIYRALPVVDDVGVFLGVIGHETIHALEAEARGHSAPDPTSAAISLAELAWLGLAGAIQAFGRPFEAQPEPSKGSER